MHSFYKGQVHLHQVPLWKRVIFKCSCHYYVLYQLLLCLRIARKCWHTVPGTCAPNPFSLSNNLFVLLVQFVYMYTYVLCEQLLVNWNKGGEFLRQRCTCSCICACSHRETVERPLTLLQKGEKKSWEQIQLVFLILTNVLNIFGRSGIW